MTQRVILVGATGLFGERLARRLASWPQITLVLAARNRGKLERLAAELRGAEVAVLDRNRPETLTDLRPFAVIDAAGPFQDFDYGFAEAVIAAGSHYIDLADGRAFVAGFTEALDGRAKAAGVVAVTGASSTPALSQSALGQLTIGWSRIDCVQTAISPAGQTRVGLAVVRAITSWAGRPARVFTQGRWRMRPGWGGLSRPDLPGIGRRWLSLAETPDLDLMVERFTPRREALFVAGLKNPFMHLGLWLLAWPVRLKLLRSIGGLAPLLHWASDRLAGLGSARGGAAIEATGLDAEGRPTAARWSLVADGNQGPHVPSLAASAYLRRLLAEGLPAGARVAAGELSLDDIVREADGLPISTRTNWSAPADLSLWRRVLGHAFDGMPAAVRRLHHGRASETFRGLALVRGSPGLAGIARRLAGMPEPGRYPTFAVDIACTPSGEAWTRRFGRRRFASRIRHVKGDIGRFEESVGPIAFRIEAIPDATGFRWDFRGWRLGPMPLPRALAPIIRARTFATGGGYRFQVMTAHPWIGVIAAYAGRLEANETSLEAVRGS